MKKIIKNSTNQLEFSFSLERQVTVIDKEICSNSNFEISKFEISKEEIRYSNKKVISMKEKLRQIEVLKEKEIIDYILSNSKRF
ncbi:hypothetical protein [uncultured Sphingobacterium sp.]|uniref:hypothetical protein n=1 Tax=uncultured Sphingobacterium sp. TaxID=182688 RepID=UPI0025DCD53D|nr:hypothetical protein [uncultured Sphingobacterium sp.]